MDPITALLGGRARRGQTARRGGAPAGYIPELATADPDQLALAVVGPRGGVRSVGDDTSQFTIQSISKPFVLALALVERGRDAVLRQVGAEPSGEPFNAISLEAGTGRPANPMVNAGRDRDDGARPGRRRRGRAPSGSSSLLSALRRARRSCVDESVYASESATGDRNRALAHLMRSYDVIEAPVDLAVESYFRQCSVLVTVRDLAVMAATLAFGGVQPDHRTSGSSSEHVARDVAVDHGELRHVRLLGRVAAAGRPAGQERRERRSARGRPVAVRRRGVQPAAGRARQQRAGESPSSSCSRSDSGCICFEPHESLAVPALARGRHGESGPVVTLGGELGFAGAERVVAVLRELAASLPRGLDRDARRQRARPAASRGAHRPAGRSSQRLPLGFQLRE